MAVYRRGWNGLTLLNPEVDTFPEDMTLKVFPVPKKVRIQTVAVKKSRKNGILWAITGTAFVVMLAAGCTLQRPTVAAGVVIGLCMAWIGTFLGINRWRIR